MWSRDRSLSGAADREPRGIQHGYRARLALCPDQRFAVAILANLSTIVPGPLVRRITDVLIDHGLVPGARRAPALDRVALTQEELTRHCGLYLDARTGGLARVSLEDGRLMLGRPPAADEMIPLAPDRFRLEATDVEAVFVPTRDGNARLEVIGPRPGHRIDPWAPGLRVARAGPPDGRGARGLHRPL